MAKWEWQNNWANSYWSAEIMERGKGYEICTDRLWQNITEPYSGSTK